MGCLKLSLLPFALTILWTTGHGAPLQFIGLGTTTGVSPVSLEREDDVVSSIINITRGFPFANTTYTSAFVCDNGLVSFGEAFCDNLPMPFPVSTRNRTLISAFWSDNDIRLAGEISYEVHELGISQDSGDLLARVGQFVSEEIGYSFEPAWMLVVEWHENHPFPHGEPDTGPGGILDDPVIQDYVALVNTYQAIAITDETLQSYAVLIYHCGMLGWAGFPPIYAVVGYTAGGAFYENHPDSGTSDIINIACLNEPSTPWVNFVYNLTFFNPNDFPVAASSHTTESLLSPIPTPHVAITSASDFVMVTDVDAGIRLSPVVSATNRISPGEVPKSKVPGGVITIVPVVVVVLILTATCTTVTFLILGFAYKRKRKKKMQVHAADDNSMHVKGTALEQTTSQTSQEAFPIPISS